MLSARCPSPVELERAFWSNEAQVRSHASQCGRCGPQWSEIAALMSLGARIETPAPSAEQCEDLRTRLLAGPAGSARVAPAPRRRTTWTWAAPAIAAAAAIVIAWWVWPADVASPQIAVRRGRILDHGGASYLLAGAQPDEIVRVVDGTITVEVAPLSRGERFRVIAGDAEVEVVGTAFDVTAAGDRLVAVRVMHGTVEVRVAGEPARRLGAGQSWHREIAAADATPSLPDAPAATVPAQPTPVPGQPGSHSAASAAASSIVSSESPRAPASRAAPARSAAQVAFDDGWSALRDGDLDRAAKSFGRAAAADGNDRLSEDATYWQAVALARGGHAERATRVFEKFLDVAPDSPRAGEASVMLGWLLFESGDLAGAERRFRDGEHDVSARVRESAAKGLEAVR